MAADRQSSPVFLRKVGDAKMTNMAAISRIAAVSVSFATSASCSGRIRGSRVSRPRLITNDIQAFVQGAYLRLRIIAHIRRTD